MKRILRGILAAMLLTGCSESAYTAEIAPPVFIQQESFTSLSDNQNSQLENYIKYLDREDLLSDLRIQRLEEKGISISLSEKTLLSFGKVSFNITLTNSDGKSVILPVECIVNYYTTDDKIASQQVLWGNLSASDNSIILTTLNNIYIIDINNLKVREIQPEFLAGNTDRYYLLDTISCDAGYTTAILSCDRQGLVIFDADGKTVSENYTYYLFGSFGHSNSDNYNFSLDKKRIALYYVDPDQTVVAVTSDDNYAGDGGKVYPPSVSSFYDIDSLTTQHYPQLSADYTYGSYRVSVFAPTNYNTHRAIKFKDGKPVDYFTFESDRLHEYFGQDENAPPVVTADSDCNTVSIYCPYSRQNLTVDFNSHSADISSVYNENWLYSVFATYGDRYYLCEGSHSGAGDAYFRQIVLKDNTTGKMKYIDTIGGMYGGSESAGFFSNGDVYTIGLDEFKVFTNDMDQAGPVFEMSKNFPLGCEMKGDIYFCHLLAARRNPDDYSWIVLYNEAPYKENPSDWYMDGELGNNFYKSTYKVGLLDKDGRLTKVYDTGEAVMTYSFRQVKMYLSAGNILNFEVVVKGKETQLHGQLDLNTGKYTCVSGGYSRWTK